MLLQFWVFLSVLSTLFPRVSNAKTCPRGRTDGAGKTGQPPNFKGRVRVEHSIAGVKVFRSVRDIYRNFKAGFEDTLIETAYGLHNLRSDFPIEAWLKAA